MVQGATIHRVARCRGGLAERSRGSSLSHQIIAETRKLNPNTQRSPLRVGIHFPFMGHAHLAQWSAHRAPMREIQPFSVEVRPTTHTTSHMYDVGFMTA